MNTAARSGEFFKPVTEWPHCSGMRPLSQVQELWLELYYPRYGAKWCAFLLCCRPGSLRHWAHLRGLKVVRGTEEWRMYSARSNYPRGLARPKQREAMLARSAAGLPVAPHQHNPKAARANGLLGAAVTHARRQAGLNRAGFPKGAHHTPAAKAKMAATRQQQVKDGTSSSLRPKSAIARERMSLASVARLSSGGNPYSRTKSGRRADLDGRFFRSRWEANYARFLNFQLGRKLIATWEYEPCTFWFDGITRGTRSYTPDFCITRLNGTKYFVEVKGWMDAKSATKLARMKTYHPGVEIQLFGAKEYRNLERQLAGALPGWEGAHA